MDKLRNSIRDLGFSSSVVVRELSDGRLQILGGRHRVLVAKEQGIEVPILNLGKIDDVQAKKISLVDNQRYGNDDVDALASVLESLDIDTEGLAQLMPVSVADMNDIIRASATIDLDDLDFIGDEDDDSPPPEAPAERPAKTHEIVKFRLTMRDAENVRVKIENTIRDLGLKGGDEMSTAGEALAFLILGEDSDEA